MVIIWSQWLSCMHGGPWLKEWKKCVLFTAQSKMCASQTVGISVSCGIQESLFFSSLFSVPPRVSSSSAYSELGGQHVEVLAWEESRAIAPKVYGSDACHFHSGSLGKSPQNWTCGFPTHRLSLGQYLSETCPC